MHYNIQSIVQYVIIAAYFVFIIAKGISKSGKIKSDDDFLLAGRNISWWVLLCTISATLIGGGASIGAIGKTYEWGILMLFVSLGWYIQFIFSGYFIAPKFRKAGLYTVAGYFSHRYDKKTHLFASILSLLFSIGVLSAQIVAFGRIISTLIPAIPFTVATLVGGTIVIVYSTAGGILAVISTDVYQFVILMVGFIVTLAVCVPDLVAAHGEVRRSLPPEFFQIEGGKGLLFLVSTFLAFLLGETFGPSYATRFCVAKDARETRKGIVRSGLLLGMIFPVVIFFIGVYARYHFPEIEPEQALPKTILRLHNPVVGGLIIAALMSAVMSSGDSILNSGSAIIVKDFYEAYFRKDDMGKKNLLLIRSLTVGLGLLGMIFALLMPDIIDILLLTYSIWAPCIILPIIAGVFVRDRSRAHTRLIFITMLGALAGTIVFMNLDVREFIQASVVGVILSVVIYFSGRLVLGLSRKYNLPESS